MKLQHTEFEFQKDKKEKRNYYKCYCTVKWKPEGKTKNWRPSAGGKTKTEARERLQQKIEAKERELEEAAQDDTKELNKDTKINLLPDELRSYFVKKQQGLLKENKAIYKPRTISDKNEILRNLILPYDISQMCVQDITRADVLEWQRQLKEDGKSDRRRKGAYNLLTDYYTHYYCIEVDTNYACPANGMTFQTKPLVIDESHIFNQVELNYYLNACTQMGERGEILTFLFLVYCRVGEATTLTWSDYHNGRLEIHSSWTKDENGKYVVDREKGKTRSSTRTIDLLPQADRLLKNRLIKTKLAEGKAFSDNQWIFPALKDKTKPLSISTVSNLHEEAMAGMRKKIRVHDLRHTGITYAIKFAPINQANALKIVSRNAGHASTDITQRIYQGVLDEEKKDFALQLGDVYDDLLPEQDNGDSWVIK